MLDCKKGTNFPLSDLTVGATNMVTPRVHRPLVDVQRTVIFRDFCCLGVSEKTWFPITNKSAYGLVCRLQVLQVVHNNRPSKLDIYSPFELKSKISIAPEASEDIPVRFLKNPFLLNRSAEWKQKNFVKNFSHILESFCLFLSWHFVGIVCISQHVQKDCSIWRKHCYVTLAISRVVYLFFFFHWINGRSVTHHYLVVILSIDCIWSNNETNTAVCRYCLYQNVQGSMLPM